MHINTLGRTQWRPVVITVFTLVVSPSICPHFLKSIKTKQISNENGDGIVGLAKGVIDDTLVVML